MAVIIRSGALAPSKSAWHAIPGSELAVTGRVPHYGNRF